MTRAILSSDPAPFRVAQALTSTSPDAEIIHPERASFLGQNYHIYSTLDTLDLFVQFLQVLISITVQQVSWGHGGQGKSHLSVSLYLVMIYNSRSSKGLISHKERLQPSNPSLINSLK